MKEYARKIMRCYLLMTPLEWGEPWPKILSLVILLSSTAWHARLQSWAVLAAEGSDISGVKSYSNGQGRRLFYGPKRP